MITSAQMYWITRLDGFHLVAGLAIFPSMAFAAVFASFLVADVNLRAFLSSSSVMNFA